MVGILHLRNQRMLEIWAVLTALENWLLSIHQHTTSHGFPGLSKPLPYRYTQPPSLISAYLHKSISSWWHVPVMLTLLSIMRLTFLFQKISVLECFTKICLYLDCESFSYCGGKIVIFEYMQTWVKTEYPTLGQSMTTRKGKVILELQWRSIWACKRLLLIALNYTAGYHLLS